MLCAIHHGCYTVVHLCYLLGVECSVRVIKSPDHIMRKPGASYNCAETWQRRKSTTEIIQCLSTSRKPERLLFFSKAPHSSTQSGTAGSFFLVSCEPLRPLMSEWLPEVVLPFSLMTCRGPGQQSGMKASLVEGFQNPFLETVTKQNINCGGYFWILQWHIT